MNKYIDVNFRCFAAMKCPGMARAPNARSARRIPPATSIHPGSALNVRLAANRPKALPRRAAARVTLEFWTIRVEAGALPCFSLVNLGKKTCLAMFPPKVVVKLWGSTFMCAVTIERSLKPECTLYTDTIRHDMMTWKE